MLSNGKIKCDKNAVSLRLIEKSDGTKKLNTIALFTNDMLEGPKNCLRIRL